MGRETGQLPQEEKNRKRKAVAELLKRNILVSPDFLKAIEEGAADEVGALGPGKTQGILIINKEVGELLKRSEENVNWFELEKSKVLSEKMQKPEAYNIFLEALSSQTTPTEKQVIATTAAADAKRMMGGNPKEISPVKIVFSYSTSPGKREVGDFVDYYLARYKAIQSVLAKRPELSNLVQIGRLKKGQISESVSVIGMVSGKQQTKSGHLVISAEDPTGEVDIIVNRTKRDAFELASNLVFDEVAAVTGNFRGNALFAANIVQPDVPFREPKHSPTEGYAVFMSDLHFGSAQFLEDDFRRFLKWINGNLGNAAQREVAGGVKYVLVSGDVVDGVGVYQDQYEELAVKDVKEQYKMCADFLSEIPQHIKIIVSPGNHDAVRAAEPQAAFSKDFAAPLLSLPNIIAVSNPAIVNIDSSENFPGFDVLLYHGYSFDYYVANVDSIRRNGGYDRADLIMKFLLQRRHLAPAHTSTLILPDQTMDPLFISVVPDIFATGHIHRTSVSEYKGIMMVNGSCWQGKTKFQERLGHNPQPSRLPILNLKTRAVKIINFGK